MEDYMLQKPPIILASASPRRRELLQLLVEKFEVQHASIDENPIAREAAEDLVLRLATAKAHAVAKGSPNAIVIGADTVVVCGSKILGKPETSEEAREMLTLLSGQAHSVLTGLCVTRQGSALAEYSCSQVTFARMTLVEIEGYLKTKEPMDKAGAYAIQGYGSRFINRVEGCYFNVVGLPISLLYRMLQQIGWQFNG